MAQELDVPEKGLEGAEGGSQEVARAPNDSRSVGGSSLDRMMELLAATTTKKVCLCLVLVLVFIRRMVQLYL